MGRINLTDRFIKSRKAAAPGRREEYLDGLLPGLALRVTDRGNKSFVLIARFPLKPKNPTRRSLGNYGELTLETAREKARAWLTLIRRGVDPRIEDGRQRAARQLGQANTFEMVAEAFLERFAAKLAKRGEAKAIIQKEFISRWPDRLASEITPKEAAEAIRAIAQRGAPYQAYNAFGWLRRLYNWAISSGEHGLQTSPVARLSAADIIGIRRESRSRTLNDEELQTVWRLAGTMGYPYGPLFQLLIVTGQREREVADATWDEFDFKERLWTIPKERMKGARSHEVPLSSLALEVLAGLPVWTRGKHLFSTTDGKTSLSGFSKAKIRLDKLIAADRIKRKLQDEKGEGAMPPWVFHDLRRTVRTHLSALPVQDMIRELVIAHARPGLHKVYDQHTYRDEKGECLNLWDDRLQNIIAEINRTSSTRDYGGA
jgi:integrase